MRVALAQITVRRPDTPEDLNFNLDKHAAFVERAAALGAEVVLFPELSVTGYEPDLARQLAMRFEDRRLASLRQVISQCGVYGLIGVPVPSETGGVNIGMLGVRPDDTVFLHTKRYLHDNESEVFEPGQVFALPAIGGYRLGIGICADVTHPEHAQAAAEAGANVYLASMVLTHRGYQAETELLREAARRHNMPVCMVNHGGKTGGWDVAGRSAVWNARGELMAAVPGAGDVLLMADLAQESCEIVPMDFDH